MFKKTRLISQRGTEVDFSQQNGPRVVIVGTPPELQEAVSGVLQAEINQFLNAQRQSYSLGIVPQHNVVRQSPRGSYSYKVNQGMEMLLVKPSYETLKMAEMMLEFEVAPIGWVDYYGYPGAFSNTGFPPTVTADLYLGNWPNDQVPFLYQGVTYDFSENGSDYFNYELYYNINLTPLCISLVGSTLSEYYPEAPNLRYIGGAPSNLSLAKAGGTFNNWEDASEFNEFGNFYRLLVNVTPEEYPSVRLTMRQLIGVGHPRNVGISKSFYQTANYVGTYDYLATGKVGLWYEQPSGAQPEISIAPAGLRFNKWVCAYIPGSVSIFESSNADGFWVSAAVTGYKSLRTGKTFLTYPCFSVQRAGAALLDAPGTVYEQYTSILPLLPPLADREKMKAAFKGEFPNARIRGMDTLY